MTRQGYIEGNGVSYGPFYGVFGPTEDHAISYPNQDIYNDTNVGVKNAIMDVLQGRDVILLGYGVSGSWEDVHVTRKSGR